MTTMFETILIANRGEIACRVIATCRRMGIRTVAVYSDADAQARHVRLADEAVRIGPAAARESYLNIDRILNAAKKTDAQAIHPGYGFLSENEEFAEACAREGIVFIGPPPAAIRAMGSKAAAKILMREAGVPMTPGYDGDRQDANFLEEQADTIGYPVMIKANAGGGGKGMRRVDARGQFAAALESCKREAAAAFGDDSVLVEKCLIEPRHVEVQVFGDTHGNVISLFERDCSVQRRHQKVIEEAPAPLLAPEQREALSRAGCSAARAVGYVGAGTVEFLLDRDGKFYFMEMNTRLQVEHPVTEMITGLDLVEWQLRIAAGEPLPLAQGEVKMRGCAIEARIYAEDPSHDFLPSIGKLVHLRFPETSGNVRIDTGVEQGDTITPFYDPMIAKLIVWEETREQAVRRLAQALGEMQVVGVANNVAFLRRLVTSPSFTGLRLDTSLIEREHAWLAEKASTETGNALALAAVWLMHGGTRDEDLSPWAARDGWRMNLSATRTMQFRHGHDRLQVEIEQRRGGLRIQWEGRTVDARNVHVHDSEVEAVLDGRRASGTVIAYAGKLHVFTDGEHATLEYVDPLAVSGGSDGDEGSLHAPMPGRVIALSVQPGDRVEKGTALMVLEAMKMECTVQAPGDGVVESFHFGVGDQVTEGALLVKFHTDQQETEH
jgi:3-methylcrotonyl-CoA carboxylase alpha subunit